jgi:hypothetical protein
MADYTVTAVIRLTTVDDPDIDEIRDDLRITIEDWKVDCEEILGLDKLDITVEED